MGVSRLRPSVKRCDSELTLNLFPQWFWIKHTSDSVDRQVEEAKWRSNLCSGNKGLVALTMVTLMILDKGENTANN